MSERPRVALLGTYVRLMRGGGEAYILNLARELGRAGVDVTLVSGWSPFRRALPLMPDPGVPHLSRPYLWELRELARVAPAAVARAAYGVARRAHARAIAGVLPAFDVVHSFLVESAAAVVQRRRPGQRTILSLWGRPAPVDTPLLRRMDVVVPTALTLAEYLEETAGVSGPMIPSGIDLEHFAPVPREVARRRLGWGGEPRLLYVGRFIAVKNLSTLLRAFVRLRERRPDARLVMTGHGILERRLRREAADLGVAGAVEFTGLVSADALVAQYSAADVLVLPSSYETFPLVVLEALACGCPAVVTTGAAEIPRHFPEVAIVRWDSPDDMARGIERVLDGGQPPVPRARLEPFAWAGIARRYAAIYEALHAERREQRVG